LIDQHFSEKGLNDENHYIKIYKNKENMLLTNNIKLNLVESELNKVKN